jgi:precorrin-6Y C5,15-methyltransferase (decarboxylating)
MDFSTLPGIYSKPLRSTPIEWQGDPLKVVSLGCGSQSTLTPEAIADLKNANVIFGAPHHFDEISTIETNAEKICFPSPFSDLRDSLEARQNEQVVVLASGDALFYGIGSWLNKLIGHAHLIFRPNVSSVQY